MRLLGFVAGILWIMSGAVHAQDVPALQILIDDPNEDGQKCGVSRQTLLTPAIAALTASPIDFENEFSSPYLYLQSDFRLRDEPRLCSWRIDLSVRALPLIDQRERFPESGFERLLLCEAELTGSASSNIAKAVSDTVQDYLKACLAAVKY